MKLTETILKSLKTPATATLVCDDQAKSLYLKHSTAGRMSWVYRSRKGGTWRVVTLGTWPSMSLAAARQKALSMGESTIPAAVTFGQLLDLWYAQRIEPRYKATKNIETYIVHGKQWLGNRQLTALKTTDFVTVLQVYAKAAPVAANRCLSNWKLALDYGVETGALESNPLARTTSRVVGGEETTRDRTLTDTEIAAVWASGEPLLRFLLLTGLRISEGQTGRLEGNRWVLDTTKNGKPHWVHLPALALAQIEPWTTSPTAVQAKLKRWCEREGIAPFTPHDLRRTFATRLAKLLPKSPHVVEKCLNHSMQGVMATYNRHDYGAERIAAAELWANELARLCATAPSAAI